MDRVIVPELLDDAPTHESIHSIRDLTRINRYLGGYRTLRSMFSPHIRRDQSFTLLDVGAASGDMGREVRKLYPNASITSLDYRAHHMSAIAGPKVIADAFHLPFAPRSFDFVFCSLFLHHFPEDAIIGLLKNFAAAASRAVLAIDLDRGPFAYRFIPATQWLFHWHPITMHDAPASVRAAFTKSEFLAMARAAGLKRASVRIHRPWSRLTLVAPVD